MLCDDKQVWRAKQVISAAWLGLHDGWQKGALEETCFVFHQDYLPEIKYLTPRLGAREKNRKHPCNEGKSGVSNRVTQYLSYPVKSLQTTLKMHQNVINILNEVLLQSDSGTFHQTWFTHWGVDKAQGISIKMKVKGKLLLNINLDEQCIHWRSPSFAIKDECVGNMQGGQRDGRPAQEDERYYGVRVRRLVWNNNFLCHIMLVHFW